MVRFEALMAIHAWETGMKRNISAAVMDPRNVNRGGSDITEVSRSMASEWLKTPGAMEPLRKQRSTISRIPDDGTAMWGLE